MFRALQDLSLYDNRLTSTIPTQLGTLRNLEKLATHDNKELTGKLPAALGALSRLKYLWVFNCNLT